MGKGSIERANKAKSSVRKESAPKKAKAPAIKEALNQKYVLKLEHLEPAPAGWFPCEAGKDCLKELKASIQKYGVIEPVIVRRVAEERYQILSGNNRVAACKELGLDFIKAEVLENISDQAAKEIVSLLNPAPQKIVIEEKIKDAGCKNQPSKANGKLLNAEMPSYLL